MTTTGAAGPAPRIRRRPTPMILRWLWLLCALLRHADPAVGARRPIIVPSHQIRTRDVLPRMLRTAVIAAILVATTANRLLAGAQWVAHQLTRAWSLGPPTAASGTSQV